ncbi:MAG: hypothetical protein LBP19_00365 [Treponema sp.]|jgi:hypothetical protein|nr:hypothetical protein [Treponema sp.]
MSKHTTMPATVLLFLCAVLPFSACLKRQIIDHQKGTTSDSGDSAEEIAAPYYAA